MMDQGGGSYADAMGSMAMESPEEESGEVQSYESVISHLRAALAELEAMSGAESAEYVTTDTTKPMGPPV